MDGAWCIVAVAVAVVYVRDVVERNSEPSSLRRNHFADGRVRYRWFWMEWAFCVVVWLDGWMVVYLCLCRCRCILELSSNRRMYIRISLCDEQNKPPRVTSQPYIQTPPPIS